MSSIHRPPHLLAENNLFFVTASAINKQKIFNSELKKNIFKQTLEKITQLFDINLVAWVVLDDHYHIEFELQNSARLPEFIRYLHGRSSREINEIDNLAGRKIWHQYWDSMICGETDLWKRFNYIHQNPIKHGYCNEFNEYKFSSYLKYIEKYGREWMEDCFLKYPIVDFTLDVE